MGTGKTEAWIDKQQKSTSPFVCSGSRNRFDRVVRPVRSLEYESSHMWEVDPPLCPKDLGSECCVSLPLPTGIESRKFVRFISSFWETFVGLLMG